MRLLLTGFGPFGTVSDNPTERLARHFDGARIGDRIVTGVALPTSFARASSILAARVAEHDVVLMLGVAERAARLRIETVGINFDDARIADIDGDKPSGLIGDGPESLPATCNTVALAGAWTRAGIPFELSTSAGAYVCNHTFYRVLCSPARARVGFIHVPAVPFETLVPAIELAISVV